jgi:hypothetical protein
MRGDAGMNLGKKPAEAAADRPVQQMLVRITAGFFDRRR